MKKDKDNNELLLLLFNLLDINEKADMCSVLNKTSEYKDNNSIEKQIEFIKENPIIKGEISIEKYSESTKEQIYNKLKDVLDILLDALKIVIKEN